MKSVWPDDDNSHTACLRNVIDVIVLFFSGTPILCSPSSKFSKNQKLYNKKVFVIIKIETVRKFTAWPHFLCHMQRVANQSSGNWVLPCVLLLLYKSKYMYKHKVLLLKIITKTESLCPFVWGVSSYWN